MSTKLIIKPLNINLTISLNPPPPPPGKSYTDPRLNVSCTDVITVYCLQQLYNTSGYHPAATNKNSIGINGFDGQFANQADLQSFYNAEVPAAVNTSFNTVLVDGACT
jgi:tripeptidyl-peptidase-1